MRQVAPLIKGIRSCFYDLYFIFLFAICVRPTFWKILGFFLSNLSGLGGTQCCCPPVSRTGDKHNRAESYVLGDRNRHTTWHTHSPSARTSSTVTVTRPTVKTLPTKLFFSLEEDELLLLLCGFSSREFSLRSNLDRIFFIFHGDSRKRKCLLPAHTHTHTNTRTHSDQSHGFNCLRVGVCVFLATLFFAGAAGRASVPLAN